MDILIIGGTRNVGHFLALELLTAGHRVTVFNRGQTPDELPVDVQRLHGDRSDPSAISKALARKRFDVVIDMALYNQADAKSITSLLDSQVGHYIFISTGQIYLVREPSPRPFIENAYELPIIPAPPIGTRDHEEWLYGVEKSQAEDALIKAWQERGFPFTTLRLPMVNSERDHFQRVNAYLKRVEDGGPILIPAGEHLRLRHIYGQDVIQAIMKLIQTGIGKGQVYNLSQDETVSIDKFLLLLASLSGHELKLMRVKKQLLEEHHLLPDCSPFSDPWMSELDNQRSKQELGMEYTPLPVYLQRLIAYYRDHNLPPSIGYERRGEEISLVHIARG